MKRVLVLIAILESVGLAQQRQALTGTISGALKGEDGTAIVGATVRLHLTPPLTSRVVQQQSDWTALTQGNGSFLFTGLPEGAYTICPKAPNSTWLNPCEWNFPTPIATISASSPNASTTVTMKRGAAVPIRIDDPAQFLDKNEGKTPGAGLLLGIASPGFFFRLVPLASKDSSGRNYQIVVPFNTQLTLVLHSSFYHVQDANGIPLSQTASTKIPLLIAASQQLLPIKFTIAGAGH